MPFSTRKQTKSLPHIIINAGPGVGKTSTMIAGLNILSGGKPEWEGTEEQKAIWTAMKGHYTSIGFQAFNKSIATEIQEKVPSNVKASTFHAFGYKVLRENGYKLKPNSNNVKFIVKDVQGYDKQGRQSSADFKAGLCIAKVVGLLKGNLLEPTAENVNLMIDMFNLTVPDTLQVTTLVSLTKKVMAKCLDVKPDQSGYMDFDDMLWLPLKLGLDFKSSRFDLLICDESQDLNPIQHELVLKSGSRLICVGDRRQCQPAGTMVSVTGCEHPTPIEDLKEGDQLVSYNSRKTYFPGVHTQGRKVLEISKREFSGEMIKITTEDTGKVSEYTPNHKCLIKFKRTDGYAVYAMQKGNKARVGTCKMKYRNGTGVSVRAKQEDADRLWILAIYSTQEEAACVENFVSCVFGLSQLTFVCRSESSVTQDWIDTTYKAVEDHNPNLMISNLNSCLEYYGRYFEYPIWEKGSTNYLGFNESSIVHACNLIEHEMLVKTFDGDSRNSNWESFMLDTYPTITDVYSLKVEPAEDGRRLYVADGIVTHNCIYGFRGADSRSMDTLKETLEKTDRGVIELSLQTTFRLPTSGVKNVNSFAPDLVAADNAIEGELEETDISLMTPKVGDLILSRINANIFSMAFSLLRKKIGVRIQGRDFGNQLKKLLESVCKDCGTVAEIQTNLAEYEKGEHDRIMQRTFPARGLAELEEKMACLYSLTGGCKSLAEMTKTIDELFSEDLPRSKVVLLSTVHRAKGMEADTVWFLEPQLIPHKLAETENEIQQEFNLKFVAETRHRKKLVYVYPSKDRDDERDEAEGRLGIHDIDHKSLEGVSESELY